MSSSLTGSNVASESRNSAFLFSFPKEIETRQTFHPPPTLEFYGLPEDELSQYYAVLSLLKHSDLDGDARITFLIDGELTSKLYSWPQDRSAPDNDLAASYCIFPDVAICMPGCEYCFAISLFRKIGAEKSNNDILCLMAGSDYFSVKDETDYVHVLSKTVTNSLFMRGKN